MPALVTADDHASRPGGLSRSTTMAVLWATAVALVMLNLAPEAEGLLQRDAHLSASQIGLLDFVELGAMALASLPSGWWLGRWSGARVAAVAYAGYAAGNLVSMLGLDNHACLAAGRALTGAAAGTLMVLGMACGLRASQPHRLYAWVTVGQLASGAVLLALVPAMTGAPHGLRGLYLLGALLGGLGWLGARAFGAQAVAAAAPPPGRQGGLGRLGFVASFNLVLGGVWAFVGEYALRPGEVRPDTSAALALATLAGLAGAVLAGAIGARHRPSRLLLGGYLVVLLGIAAMQLVRGGLGFVLGSCLLCLGWNFSVPIILTTVAATDPSGRAMSGVNLAFALGLALGPWLVGTLMDHFGLVAVLPFSVAGLVLSWALAGPATRRLNHLAGAHHGD